MNALFLIISILVSFILFFLGILLLKNKYIKEFEEDNLISSDEEKYAFFDVDEKYKNYLISYKIIKNENDRFLTLKLKRGVNYLDLNLTCFKNQKVLKIINVKDTFYSYKEDYIIKLPLDATSFKIDLLQANEEIFDETKDVKKSLWKYFLSSFLLSIGSIIPLTLISFIVFSYNPIDFYDSWENVINAIFYEPFFYILASILFVLLFIAILLFLILFNKKKVFKYKENDKKADLEAKDLDIYDYFKYKVKVKKDRLEKCEYFEISFVKNLNKFLDGDILIKAYDQNSEPLISFPFHIDKRNKKINIKKDERIKELKVSYQNLYFKDFKYVNKEVIYNEYLNKEGVKGNTIHTKGVVPSIISFALIFVISLSFLFSSSQTLDIYRNIDSYLDYEFVDEEDESKGVYISSSSTINIEKVYIPKTIDGYNVIGIGEEAFKDNKTIKEVYFSSPLVILKSAFENCTSLEYVDLNDCSKIGTRAFYNTNLKNIEISINNKEISTYAFSKIPHIENLIIDGKETEFSSSVFSGSYIYNDFLILSEPKYFGHYTFSTIGYYSCFIYEYERINKTNFSSSYLFNKDSTYFLSECVHDAYSFIIENEKRITEIDSELIDSIEGTCMEAGYDEYLCHRCNKTYQISTGFNFDNHHFVDGRCEWCGRSE